MVYTANVRFTWEPNTGGETKMFVSSIDVRGSRREILRTTLLVLGLLFTAESIQVQSRPISTVPLKPSSRSEVPLSIENDDELVIPTDIRYADEYKVLKWREQYWADPRMHGFGNTGSIGAKFHAFVAPFFTFLLDKFAYGNTNVRSEAWKIVKRVRNKLGAPRVTCAVDMGCGTGFTARSLARAFFSRPRGDVSVVALDASPEMIKVARDLTSMEDESFLGAVHYSLGNIENTGLSPASFDVVVAAFVMHECPKEARHRILEEGLRILAPGGTLAVLDIHTDFKPTEVMLSGEPYLNGYLDNFEQDISDFATRHAHHFVKKHRDVVFEDRLTLWHFHAKPLEAPPPFDIRK